MRSHWGLDGNMSGGFRFMKYLRQNLKFVSHRDFLTLFPKEEEVREEKGKMTCLFLEGFLARFH